MESHERPGSEAALAAQLGSTLSAAPANTTSRAGAGDSPAAGVNLDRFSPKTRQILASAAEQARQLGHGEIRPEHLLLALLLEPGTEILRPLRAAAGRIDLVNLRESLVERLGSIEHAGRAGLVEPSGLSDGCKQVLQEALREAGRIQSPQVGPAHLLLGLVMEGNALAGSSVITSLAARGLRASLGSRAWRIGGSSERMAAGQNVHATTVEQTGPRHTYTRDNVITFRVTDQDLAAVDALVDSGAMRTRSEASAWLLRSGIAANKEYFDEIQRIGDEIARLRQEVQRLTEAHIGRMASTQEADNTTAVERADEPSRPQQTA